MSHPVNLLLWEGESPWPRCVDAGLEATHQAEAGRSPAARTWLQNLRQARLLSHCFPVVAKPGGKLGSQGGTREGRLWRAEISGLALVVQDRHKATSQIEKGAPAVLEWGLAPPGSRQLLQSSHLPASPSLLTQLCFTRFCFWSLLRGFHTSGPFHLWSLDHPDGAGLLLSQSRVLCPCHLAFKV